MRGLHSSTCPPPLVPQPALPPSFLNLHAPLPADVQDADLLEAFLNLPVPSPPPPTLFSTCPSSPPPLPLLDVQDAGPAGGLPQPARLHLHASRRLHKARAATAAHEPLQYRPKGVGELGGEGARMQVGQSSLTLLRHWELRCLLPTLFPSRSSLSPSSSWLPLPPLPYLPHISHVSNLPLPVPSAPLDHPLSPPPPPSRSSVSSSPHGPAGWASTWSVPTLSSSTTATGTPPWMRRCGERV